MPYGGGIFNNDSDMLNLMSWCARIYEVWSRPEKDKTLSDIGFMSEINKLIN